MAAGRFRIRIKNMNAQIPIDGGLQEHQAKLPPAKNTDGRCQESLKFVVSGPKLVDVGSGSPT